MFKKRQEHSTLRLRAALGPRPARMSSDAPSGLTERRDAAAPMPGDLVRALEWLRAHLGEPIQLETLAGAAGVRPRTLEAHFKAFLGTTPLEWLRRMRLARARQELLNPAPGTTVTAVALASGFTQLGRFAGQYREAYGELPSTTLQGRGSPQADIEGDLDEAMRLTLNALPLAFAVAPEE